MKTSVLAMLLLVGVLAGVAFADGGRAGSSRGISKRPGLSIRNKDNGEEECGAPTRPYSCSKDPEVAAAAREDCPGVSINRVICWDDPSDPEYFCTDCGSATSGRGSSGRGSSGRGSGGRSDEPEEEEPEEDGGDEEEKSRGGKGKKKAAGKRHKKAKTTGKKKF